MKGTITMKKILSLIIFSALLLTVFPITPSAVPELTLKEAEDLIRQMVDFKYTVLGDVRNNSKYMIDIPSFQGAQVDDKAVLKEIRKKTGIDESNDDIFFYELEGEYGKASFWFDRLRNFLTDEYVEKNLQLDFALIQVGENVYTPTSVAYAIAPDFPNLTYGKSISECITIIDDDTVMFEASYEYENSKQQIDFEYTENGWRISGGEGAKSFLRYAWRYNNTDNPETSDGVTPIIVCLVSSALGIIITLKRRRHYTV